MNHQIKNKEAWKVSKKYSEILINNLDKDILIFSYEIYKQYINELKFKKILYKDRKYNQVWITMLNTISKNPNYKKCISSIRILHQTNIQRSQ